MNILGYYVFPFIVVLGILIFFHELGHFLMAKYFGVKVLKFSLGFGYKLAGKKIGDTEYLISTIPFGGYVKMLGENDDDNETLPPYEAERAFNNQHVLKRIAIVAAGPIFNLILALFLFSGLYLVSGNHVMTTEIGQVRPESPAYKAGLKKGDVILSVQGKMLESWSEIKKQVQDQAGNPLVITVQRADQTLSLTVIPEESVVKNIFGEEVKSALIGIVASGQFKKLEMGPLQSIKEGFRKTWEVIHLTCLTIVKLFQGVVPIKTLGGPILIGQMTGQLAKESFIYLIPFMAVISINLGILNLLPIPILDGGVIIFLLIELFVGKPIGLRKRDMAQKVGLFLLIFLMAVVFYNDILRLFE
ncbi:MAG: RIP metalloprotease RseP [Deltaproteobacteria bacterium]|nr:RIP metalloprotease RseP [Deltaproteobacteria bacterium]